MTHEYAGHYATKHPEGTRLDSEIAEKIKAAGPDRSIACAVAHEIAAQLNRSPSEIGTALDLMEFRILKCQLGLFGYAPEKKIVAPANHVPDKTADTIRRHMKSGRLACLKAWQLAEELGMRKLALASACENLGVKISPCQLGAF
jgi:hypothetical protein